MAADNAAFKFGDFDYICEHASLVVCPLLGAGQGIIPTCYSRNVQLGSQIIFQPATCFAHIAALGMTAIMLYHVRSKYTAVGRKEIVMFFYIYMFVELFAIFLDSTIIPTANAVYPWFTAVYAGAIGALYWCIMINGFVGFQFHEDGTPMSLWFLRLSSLVVWAICFFVSIATFKSYASLSPAKPAGLFVTYLIFPAVCVVIYFVSQMLLVIRTLDDRWVIGDLLFMAAFYVAGILLLLAFSVTICDSVSHYIDGVFFFTVAMLFTVMMVYKYWDSITKEDLEFSVGSKQAVWEVKDPLMSNANTEYYEDDAQSSYRGAGGSLVGGYGGNQYYGGAAQQGGYQQGYASGSGSGAGYSGGYQNQNFGGHY
ncbi:chitin synthase export chaperone [Cryptococcus sp. DSM 104549]